MLRIERPGGLVAEACIVGPLGDRAGNRHALLLAAGQAAPESGLRRSPEANQLQRLLRLHRPIGRDLGHQRHVLMRAVRLGMRL